MRPRNILSTATFLIAVVTLAFSVLSTAWAAERTIYSFRSGKDGANPHGALISDSAGNLYGTTEYGGKARACPTSGCGTVFELLRQANGSYIEQVLYSFQAGNDGMNPWAALTMDSAGNLYGTTLNGGVSVNCNQGCGTIFELTKGTNGSWTESVLYTFQGGVNDGIAPGGQLLLDSAGNLYGTTFYGGQGGCFEIGCGFVFELSPSSSAWTETSLYSFTGLADGGEPSGALTMDSNGNLYGTTEMESEAATGGTVFELAHSSGSWQFSTIATFDSAKTSSTGAFPTGGVIFDSAGNLYGTVECGGYGVVPSGWSPCTYGFGGVFELSPGTGGVWTEQFLYRFIGSTNSAYPDTPLIFDPSGNLYGTTFYGGDRNGQGGGTVFELSPTNGTWSASVLTRFQGITESGGVNSYAGVLRDSSGNLYGTNYNRGVHGYGAVFEFTP